MSLSCNTKRRRDYGHEVAGAVGKHLHLTSALSQGGILFLADFHTAEVKRLYEIFEEV